MITPDADERLLQSLRDVVAGAGYEHGIAERTRRLVQCLPPADAQEAALAAGECSEPLVTLLALFVCGMPVSRERAELALRPLRLEDLHGAGVLELDGRDVRSALRVVPCDGLLLLGEGLEADGRDYVGALYGRSSPLTSWLTPRDQRGSMLDLGTGAGAQALLASRHCARVVGVDVNPRALAFAEANARLNGARNVEWREGNWLEPVPGERFDLVVCNPPYVVSPDSEFTYRDSGLPGGELLARLCREIPEHLEDHGLAILIGEWPHATNADWQLTPREWAQTSGCDAIVVCMGTTDLLGHALGWNVPPARWLEPALAKGTVARWHAHHRAGGAGAISFGAVVLRRRAAAVPWTLEARSTSKQGDGAWRQVVRMIGGNDMLASGADLLEHSYALPEGLSVAQRFVRREDGWGPAVAVAGVAGELGVSAAIDPDALEVLFRCDGRQALGDLVRAPAQRDLALRAVRKLLAHGLLESV